MPGVTEKYCRYKSAGDQYYGIVLCGLPLFSLCFGFLPPHFQFTESIRQVGEKNVHDLVVFVFLSLSTELWTIMIYGLVTLA